MNSMLLQLRIILSCHRIHRELRVKLHYTSGERISINRICLPPNHTHSILQLTLSRLWMLSKVA